MEPTDVVQSGTDGVRSEVPTILISAYRHISIMYIFQSAVFAELQKIGARIVVMVHDDEVEHHRRLLAPYGVTEVEPMLYATVRQAQYNTNRGRWFTQLRRIFSGASSALVNTTNAAWSRQIATQHQTPRLRVEYALIRMLAWLAGKSRFLRQKIVDWETAAFPGAMYDPLFVRHNPRLLIVGSFGYQFDPYLMRAAVRHGCYTVALVQSWDNTSTKGYRGAMPDEAIVWNEEMREELAVFQDIPRERIHVGGVPRWDYYFDGSLERVSRATYLASRGLSAERAIVVFGASSCRVFPDTLEALEAFLDQVRAGRLCREIQLVFRPHPSYLGGDGSACRGFHERFAALQERYPGLLALDMPQMESAGRDVYWTDDEMRRLALLLEHCDVLLTQYSTLMIEGAVLDRPVINVSLGSRYSEEQLQAHTHLQRVIDCGAARNASTVEEAIASLNEYLEHPERDREARAALVDRKIPLHRGCAGRKTGELIRLAWERLEAEGGRPC